MDISTPYGLLLAAHALAGAVTLAGALVAIGSRLFGWPHRTHVVSGNAFSLGMVGVAVTGLGITVVKPSLFLVALAVFLLYLVVFGWRHATARKGIGGPVDRVLAVLFLAAFLAQLLWGASVVVGGNTIGWVLVVFGAIGALQAGADVRSVLGTPPTGRGRIIAHLTRMLGGTIGVTTAFLLVQAQSDSVWLWLGPTIVLTPLIVVWSRKVRGGWLPPKRPDGVR